MSATSSLSRAGPEFELIGSLSACNLLHRSDLNGPAATAHPALHLAAALFTFIA
jgi:hypothetical protein